LRKHALTYTVRSNYITVKLILLSWLFGRNTCKVVPWRYNKTRINCNGLLNLSNEHDDSSYLPWIQPKCDTIHPTEKSSIVCLITKNDSLKYQYRNLWNYIYDFSSPFLTQPESRLDNGVFSNDLSHTGIGHVLENIDQVLKIHSFFLLYV
jgi:hypothetical protein